MIDVEKILKEIDNKINTLTEQGLTSTATIEGVYKLVDIKKDMLEIQKMEKHRYQGEYGENSNYSEGNYGRRYREQSYNDGSYNEYNYGENSYGRRGVKGTGRGRRRYRGDDMLDEMNEHYGVYSEGREQYRDGNYGAEGKTTQALEFMLESVVDFVKMLKQEAGSPKETQLIDKYIHKLQEM